ncbi:MAG: response regulator [Desulfovibrionaceae bacterium]|nr:response regulator [Desulfovibrionaceae bacterium]
MGCNLLLVDDEEAILDTLRKRLTRRGYGVLTANSGAAALDELQENPVDVAVLDVKMPGMDGIELLALIKQRHPRVEVIMLTGHANVEAAMRGMELGAFDYLMKPADFEDLLYKIEDAYKKMRIREMG